MHFPASVLKTFFPKRIDLKNIFVFSQKRVPNFEKTELSYIHNHSIFRTWGSFRTLPNIYDGTYYKNSYVAHFSAPASTFSSKNSLHFLKSPLIFRKQNFSYILRKAYLEAWHNRKWSYISLISQEVTFGVWKMKKTTLKMFLIFQEIELSSSKLKKLLTF